MSAEHSFFEKLKRKTVKALEFVFFSDTDVWASLYSDKGLQ